MKYNIIILLMCMHQLCFAQIGTRIEPTQPDTVYIQYLVKKSFEINTSLATVMSEDLIEYAQDYDFEFYVIEDRVKYVVKCWNSKYLEIHEIIQSHYPDAYFIDSNGWRLNLGSLKN